MNYVLGGEEYSQSRSKNLVLRYFLKWKIKSSWVIGLSANTEIIRKTGCSVIGYISQK